MHDNDDRALTAAERQRMEAELARLETELPGLAAAENAALAAWDALPHGLAERRAWRAYEHARRDHAEVRQEVAGLRERLADEDARADHAAWAADRGVRS